MIEFLQGLNWAEITTIIVGFVVAFERLAKATPTNTDNKIVAFAYKVFSILGVNVPDNKGKKETK